MKSVGLLMAVEMEALQCSAGLDCLVRIGEGKRDSMRLSKGELCDAEQPAW